MKEIITLEFSPYLVCAATPEYGPGFLSPVCVGTAHCVLRQCQGGCHRSVDLLAHSHWNVWNSTDCY